jgi:NAD(P)-dependent dehydrogenase (short-subunit alcohol dehydrogenase family)
VEQTFFGGLIMEQKELVMTGKTCMITGATSGIGKATALELARRGAVVIMVSRNTERCAQAVDFIRQETGNLDVDFMVADLSSQAEIRRLAQGIHDQYSRLDVLVNNVGGMFLRRKESVDGIEMTFALNHLSYFLLTNLLLDLLRDSKPARIVNVSSNGHYGKLLNFDDLQFKHRYQGLKAYGCSKMANVFFTYELARRLEDSGITVNALHPGFVATNIAKDNGFYVKLIYPILERRMITPEEGAQTSIYLASSPDVEGMTGKFFVKKKAVKSDLASYDEAAQKRLWKISAELTGLKVK